MTTQQATQALPDDLFPSFRKGQRSVHRDSYAEVDDMKATMSKGIIP